MDPLLPNENSQVPAGHKVVSLIRHGQATHNYVRDVTHDVKHYLDEAFTDCPLTDLGEFFLCLFSVTDGSRAS